MSSTASYYEEQLLSKANRDRSLTISDKMSHDLMPDTMQISCKRFNKIPHTYCFWRNGNGDRQQNQSAIECPMLWLVDSVPPTVYFSRNSEGEKTAIG